MVALLRFAFARLAAPAALTLVLSTTPSAQTASGVIAGRVMLDGEPAPGVIVSLLPADPWAVRESAPAPKVKTDQEGRYRLAGVPPGRSRVTAMSSVYVVAAKNDFGYPGQPVTIGEGESVEGIDFALSRGGVVTGRLTDPEGRAAIGQRVRLSRLEEGGRKSEWQSHNHLMFQSDDRGVYRLYGVPPGRYLVSAGVDEKEDRGGAAREYKRTYHPNAAEASQAKIVEIAAGGETGNIDIVLGNRSGGHAVTVRVVDAETGQPLPNLMLTVGRVNQEAKEFTDTYSHVKSDAGGEARFDGLTPGSYGATVVPEFKSSYNSEAAVFEMADADLSGIVVRARRGATLSGAVVIENAGDPAAAAALSQLLVNSQAHPEEGGAIRLGWGSGAMVEGDGTFRLTGLRPGRHQLSIATYRGTSNFFMLRIERDGVPQPKGVEVEGGENITGLRVIVAYGSNMLRGQVQVRSALPDGVRLHVTARQVSAPESGERHSEVDSRGRFVIEGLPAGEYELTVHAFGSISPGESGRSWPTVKQKVTVTGGAQAEVTVGYDAHAREAEK